MELAESFEIEAPLALVWSLLGDVDVVAACLPGVELRDSDGDAYRGTMVVKFGPTTVRFQGQAEVIYGEETGDVVIRARGRDARGATKASADVKVVASGGDHHTTVEVCGEVDVVGPLAQFARTGGIFVTRELLADFADCLGARAQDMSTPQQSPRTSVPSLGEPVAQVSAQGATAGQSDMRERAASTAQDRPLSGFRLLWRVARAWLADRRRGRGMS